MAQKGRNGCFSGSDQKGLLPERRGSGSFGAFGGVRKGVADSSDQPLIYPKSGPPVEG